MGNLIRMDLYRMNRGKSFRVCLILAFVVSLLSTPVEELLISLARMLSPDTAVSVSGPRYLNEMIASPASSLVYMLAMLSVVIFFYADMENGYIKNIAGQMPRRGFSILSRYIAAAPHNLVFLLVSLAGNLIGTLPFGGIAVNGSIPASIETFLLKLLLLQGICAILLLTTASFRNKSLGMILAVLLGLSLMTLIYWAVDSGLQQLFNSEITITPYMPDQVLKENNPGIVRALLVSAVTIGVFLPLSIRVFDKKDVK